MLFAAATVWLMLVVLLAWGVHHLWSGMIRPKVVNALLLPGTLVAQIGHAIGLLLTGGTVNDMALMKDDDTGAPQTPAEPKTRLPVVGLIVVALLPMLALGVAIYQSVRVIGGPMVLAMPAEAYVSQTLPTTLPAFWEQLRALITLAERTVQALRAVDLMDWRNALFVYLVVCMSVRMAPLPGNLRGHLGAVLITGLLTALAASLVPAMAEALQKSWPVLTLTVATLLLLLLASLAIRGVVGLVRMLAQG